MPSISETPPSPQGGVREAWLKKFWEEKFPHIPDREGGNRINETAAEEVQADYDAKKIIFPWKDGDLLLDSKTMADGRPSDKGARKVSVAMVKPYSDPTKIR
jgi:hypothetical protein